MAVELISHYRIIRKLGAGGMGEVLLAEDTRLRRKVALKLLSADLTQNEDKLRRFEQEAQAASALNHPNIITIYDFGEDDGVHFIATEFIEGETLRQRLAHSRMTVQELLNVATQVASALSAAHRAGIIHRDIKPENVMTRPDGYVKVLDFGIAKLVGNQGTAGDTQSPTIKVNTDPGTVLGTVKYMSPEQARGQAIDARSDIFSFGVLLYEMVSGISPFDATSIAEVFISILQHQPPVLTHYLPEVPPELERIIRKCLEKQRDWRYQTADELTADLKNLCLHRSQEQPAAKVTTPIAALGSNEQPAVKVIASIAVLPLVNMSADPDNDYFCDGLAEELLNALSKVEGLKVAARTSAFSFKGKDVKINDIGRALNVSTVLEGSVRKAGNRLRITAQLINAADGYHLWSERYDRQMEDVFDIQDEITLAIVDALKLTLLGEQKESLLKRHTENTEAYRLYLKGRYHFNKWTAEGLRSSIEFFEQAIALEPNYALPYTGLADTYGTMRFFGYVSPAAAQQKTSESVERALELDDTLAEAHLMRAKNEYFYQYNFPAAVREYRRAIELNPNSSDARIFYAYCLLQYKQRVDQALAEAERALELDPLSLVVNMIYAFLFIQAGRYDEARNQALKLLELEPNFYGSHWVIGGALLKKGLYEDAIAECEKAMSLGGGSQAMGLLGYAYGAIGEPDKAGTLIERLMEQRGQGFAVAYQIATVYAGLGDSEKALEWLEKAYEERGGGLTALKVDPAFDDVRSDRRFQDLLSRVGLDGD